jgi:hypothetical protein
MNSRAPNFRPAHGLRTHFLCAWLLYWVLAAAMPVESAWMAHAWEAFLLQLSFVGLTVLGLSLPSLPEPSQPSAPPRPIDVSQWIIWALLLSAFGLLLQVFDKVVVQGIDYSQGIASARIQWRDLGEERAGQASSLASVASYLLGSAHYVAMMLLMHEDCRLSPRRKLLAWGLVLLLLMSNLSLTGGRSGLLFVLSLSVAMCARRGDCVGMLMRLPFRYKLGVTLAGLVCMAYALYVFYMRALLSGFTAHEYAIDFLPYLGLTPSQALSSLDPESLLSSVVSLMVLAGGYLTHSLQTTMAILDAPLEDKTVVFSYLQSLLARGGLMSMPETDWFLAGLFPSLPGALYHQWGIGGVLLGGATLGLVGRVIAGCHRRRPGDLLPLCAYGLIHAVLVLSPMLMAADFLNFPFIATAAAAVSALALLNRRWLGGAPPASATT